MVEYTDGAIIAELGSADMRLPIQYALNYTKRKKEVAKSIDFYEISKLTFEKPDMNTFKCLKIAYEVGKNGGLLPTVLNGANEVAVQLFLDRKIKFLEIAEIIENTLKEFKDECKKELNLDNIIALDKKVRNYVINKYN